MPRARIQAKPPGILVQEDTGAGNAPGLLPFLTLTEGNTSPVTQDQIKVGITARTASEIAPGAAG